LKSKSKKSTSKSKVTAKKPAPKKAASKKPTPKKPAPKGKEKVASVKARMARSLAKSETAVTQPEPGTTAPPPVRAVLPVAPPRPHRRVSIGEALAQLNAATLEGVTAELTPFGLNPDAPLTPSPSLASLLGPEPRPLSALVAALERWDGEGADLTLMNEARALLDPVPRIAEDLEAFLRRHCTM
jgi:hypothetical protein